MRVSVTLPGRRALALTPFVETRHSQVTRRGFDEVGAGSVSLAGVDARTTTSARTLVGLRTGTSSQLLGVRVEPLLSVAWTHEGRDVRSGMQAALSGMMSRSDFQAFALSGAPDVRSGGLVDAGVSVSVANHGRAFVAYDGLLTGKRTEHSFAAGLWLVW
jgi:outer membrane autotransporter protein